MKWGKLITIILGTYFLVVGSVQAGNDYSDSLESDIQQSIELSRTIDERFQNTLNLMGEYIKARNTPLKLDMPDLSALNGNGNGNGGGSEVFSYEDCTKVSQAPLLVGQIANFLTAVSGDVRDGIIALSDNSVARLAIREGYKTDRELYHDATTANLVAGLGAPLMEYQLQYGDAAAKYSLLANMPGGSDVLIYEALYGATGNSSYGLNPLAAASANQAYIDRSGGLGFSGRTSTTSATGQTNRGTRS